MSEQATSKPLHAVHGCCLMIDVGRSHVQRMPIPGDVLRGYVGGSGLGAWLMLHHNAAALDPLSPEAPLAFVFSPLVGSPLTTSAKFAVVGKSPLTQRFNDSLVSSGFAISGKGLGCDALLLTGRAPRLSILVVEPDRARVVAAEELRGLSCQDVETHLRRIHPGASIAVIGPAGENLVRYASISHDGRHAGRGGNGAVLGSKNIKAIVVRGNRRPTWAYPEELTRYARDLSRRSFGPATEKYRELGTAANLLLFNRLRALPTRNFQQGSFPHAEKLAPESLRDQRAVTRTSCRACTIGCTHMYAPGDPQGRPVRLEYENLFALGPLCEIDDPEIVVRASHRCDELGMDVISTGATIAFAMECVERGLLNEPWLRFADGEALLRAIDWIGRREGVGDLLADGSRSLAEAIGHGAGEFAPHVKGLEIPGYEPRALQTMGLGFAVGARGADHNRSNAYEHDFSHTTDRRSLTAEGVELAVESEDRAAIMDSLILCKFLRKTLDDFLADAAEMLRLVAGWEMQPEELQDGARRIVNAKRVFNQRAGWTIAEDTLPPRMLQQALGDDPEARLNEPTLRAMVQHYQRCRGWDAAGQPTASQILDLKLPLDAG